MPATGADYALTTWALTPGTSTSLRLEAIVNTLAFGGFIFDYQDEFNFKFAAVLGATHQLAIGHRNASGWNLDLVVDDPVAAGTDHELALIVGSSTVRMLVNGQTVLNWTQTTLLTDGLLGFFTLKGTTTFDDLLVHAFVP